MPSSLTVTLPLIGPDVTVAVRSSPSTSSMAIAPLMAVSSSPETTASSAVGASFTFATFTVTMNVSVRSPSETSTSNESVPKKSPKLT